MGAMNSYQKREQCENSDEPAVQSAEPNCFLNPLGAATVLKRVHTGAFFEVFRVRVDDREYAVKSPRCEPLQASEPRFPLGFGPKKHPSARDWDLPVEMGCWSASAFMRSVSGDPIGFVRPAKCTPADWSWLGFALLGAESEHLRRTRGRWNHDVVALGLWDEGDRAHTDSEQPSRRWVERLRPALIMPWHDGDDLAALSRDQQRELFPRMLPALWDALLIARHGDLSPSNLRLLRDRQKFVLLDPGVFLQSPSTSRTPCSVDSLDMFITNTQTYPLLHPYMANIMPVELPTLDLWAPRTPLEPHGLAALVSWHCPARMNGHWIISGNAKNIQSRPRPGPPPADWLAAGVIYFVILTGSHPFYRKGFDAPAWAGARTSMLEWTPHPRSIMNDPDFPRWAERCRDDLASTPGLKDTERRLAIDLLSLSFATREQLIEALVPLVNDPNAMGCPPEPIHGKTT